MRIARKSPWLFLIVAVLFAWQSLLPAAGAPVAPPAEKTTLGHEDADGDPRSCQATAYTNEAPPDAHTASWSPRWYGNGVLWAAGGPWNAGPDGVKVLWYRAAPGKLTISGRRLDGPAAPLVAHVPDGYGETGLQATGLYFPSAGCWEVVARAGSATLRFVVNVKGAGDNRTGDTEAVPQAPATALPQPAPAELFYVLDSGWNWGGRTSRILGIDPGRGRVALEIPTRSLPEVLLSEDGSRLIVLDSYLDRVIRGKPHAAFAVYDARTGELLQDDVPAPADRVVYKAHPVTEAPFLFAPASGRALYLARYSAQEAGQLRVSRLDPETFEIEETKPWPAFCERRLAIQPDGRWLCLYRQRMGASDQQLIDLDFPRSGLPEPIGYLAGDVVGAAFSPTARRLYIVTGDSVTAFDTAGRRMLSAARLPVSTARPITGQVALSPDGRRLYMGIAASEDASSGESSQVAAYDTTTWERLGAFDLSSVPAWHFALSSTGDRLYSASPSTGSVAIFDTATFARLRLIDGLRGSPAQVLVPAGED